MKYQVPQFIDIEDKIAFQLTAKQLGWFAGGGFILFVLWSFFTFSTFVFLGIIVIGISAAFAFIKINGAPLLDYLIYGVVFFIKPRVFVWNKDLAPGDGIYHQVEERASSQDKKLKTKRKEIKDLDKIVNILNSQ